MGLLRRRRQLSSIEIIQSAHSLEMSVFCDGKYLKEVLLMYLIILGSNCCLLRPETFDVFLTCSVNNLLVKCTLIFLREQLFIKIKVSSLSGNSPVGPREVGGGGVGSKFAPLPCASSKIENIIYHNVCWT